MNTQIRSDAPENEMTNEVELSVEELEAVVAPGLWLQHNETLVTDEEGSSAYGDLLLTQAAGIGL